MLGISASHSKLCAFRLPRLFTCHYKRYYHDSHLAVRVRFAPSPTGFLHLGGLRTALYNYLFAKRHGGAFLLRIEDTDQSRVVPGSREDLEDVLTWMGLPPDEGPSVGGKYGPYVQSQRVQLYREKAHELVQKGAAYKCFCTEERLNLLRKEAARNKETPRYDGKCRSLTASEIKRNIAENKPYVIRFKLRSGLVTFQDAVCGEISLDISKTEGDPVILKSDGFPTYHLACVVDDSCMQITHVLRGVEWQVSTPKHIMLYEAFNCKPPVFAHLPLILNKDGTKLSKRQGDIRVSLLKEQTYLPIALLNFVCSFGGGFGKQGELEILTMEEIISKFSLDRINVNSACMDRDKLDAYNRLALCQLVNDPIRTLELRSKLRELVQKTYPEWEGKATGQDDQFLQKILEWSTARIHTLSDLVAPPMKFLWVAPDLGTLKGGARDFDVSQALQSLIPLLEQMPPTSFNRDELIPQLRSFCEEKQIKFSAFMRMLRLALTGLKEGPSIGEIFELLGQDKTVERLKAVVNDDQEKFSTRL